MKLTRTPFYFLRHGQTDWNLENRAQGQTDVPLNDVGLLQARSACAIVEPLQIQTICSSPLSRALATAQIIGDSIAKPVQILDDLAECSWGIQEGQTKSTWYSDWKNERKTPTGAEVYSEFLIRALAGINKALENTGPVLIVAHGGVYWAIQKYAGLGEESDLPHAAPVYHDPIGNKSTLWQASPIY